MHLSVVSVQLVGTGLARRRLDQKQILVPCWTTPYCQTTSITRTATLVEREEGEEDEEKEK